MKSRSAALVLATVAMTLASACSSSSSSGGSTTTTIKVGFDSPQAYTNNMPTLIAIQQGYFKKQGLNVTTVGFTAGSDALKGLISGSIQVQAGVGFDVVAGQAKGLKNQAFYGEAKQSDFGLFVLNSSSIKTFSDLDGKSTAISGFGSYTDYLSKALASKEKISNFKEVPLHQTPAIVGAVLNGSVDSAWEPMALAPLFKGKARALPFSDLGLASQYSTLSATSSFLKGNASSMKKFVTAIDQAITWHKANRSAAIALAVSKLGVPQQSAEQGYEAALKIYATGGAIDESGMTAMATAVPALKLGPKAPSVSDMINTDIVK